MRGPSRQTPSSAANSRADAAASPRCSSISTALQTAPHGFAMPWPAMSGAEPCTGSKSAGHAAAGAEVRARRHAHAALQRGAEVGEDVAEEIRGDDDVEAVGPQHHARRERIHEHVLVADVRIARGDLGGDLVPEHVAEARGIRLGRARQHPAPLARELEGVLDDALDARRA